MSTRFGSRLSLSGEDLAQITTNKTNITTNTSEIASVAAPTIDQSVHGFNVLDAIRHNGSSWVKAQADATGNVATHVVSSKTTDSFTAITSGQITKNSHGLSLVQQYLSGSSAGALVTSAPAIAQPILRPISANVVEVNVQRATTSSAADARTVYTKSFKISHSEVAAKGATHTSSFVLGTLGPYEGVRWIWFRTATAWVGINFYASVSFTGGSSNVLLYSQTNFTAAGNYDDNARHNGSGWDGLTAHRQMGHANAEYDATTLMGLEKELIIHTESEPGGTNHDDATAGVTYVNVEIVRYDPTQATTVS